MILPPGWTTLQHGRNAVFRSPDHTAQINISVRELPADADERGFADTIRQEAINTHAQRDEHFDIHGWKEDFTAQGHWRQRFVWTLQASPDSCITTREDVIFRSMHFPLRPRGYVITLSACSERFGQHIQHWETSFHTFTEAAPKR